MLRYSPGCIDYPPECNKEFTGDAFEGGHPYVVGDYVSASLTCSAFATDHAYAEGDCISSPNGNWVCLTAHTSAKDWATEISLYRTLWRALGLGNYKCLFDHTSEADWTTEVTLHPDYWAAAPSYIRNDGHIAGTNQCKIEGGPWNPSTYYTAGTILTNLPNGVTYRAIDTHVSGGGTLLDDIAHWEVYDHSVNCRYLINVAQRVAPANGVRALLTGNYHADFCNDPIPAGSQLTNMNVGKSLEPV